MNGVLDPVVTGEKIVYTNVLFPLCQSFTFFLNTSFYVALILSETQLTVLNMNGCMEKVPK